MIKDHYTTLGLTAAATSGQILKARNRLLKEKHPDFHPGEEDEAKEKTIDILLAAEILLDPAAREEYDRMHKNVFGRSTRSGTAGTADRTYRPRPAGPRDEQRFTKCPHCGYSNPSSERKYCMFCGKGIGDIPEDFLTYEYSETYRRSRASRRNAKPAEEFKPPGRTEIILFAAYIAVLVGVNFLPISIRTIFGDTAAIFLTIGLFLYMCHRLVRKKIFVALITLPLLIIYLADPSRLLFYITASFAFIAISGLYVSKWASGD